MSSVPMAAPTPTPAASHTAAKTSASASAKASVKTDNVSSSSDLSFLSFMLAGFLNNQQSFPTTPAGDSAEPVMTPVSFGGTFNMDPSMLVLPEGIDASALIAGADGELNFSAELLAALTPGVPSEISAVGVSADGQVAVKLEGDPRLIATGLSPAQMQALVANITAMSSVAVETPVPAVPNSVAVVSFLPDTTVTTTASAAAAIAVPDADATTDIVSSLLKKLDAAPADQDVSIDADVAIETDDFDPLEFRLAAKPSRYGSVSLYQTAGSAPITTSAAVAADASSSASAVIKGVMQNAAAGNDTAGPAFTSAFKAGVNAELPDGLITTNPLLAPTILTSTPAQSSGLTNPVLQNITAVQSHPTTQAVAALINKSAQQGNGTQTLAIQLDPPELGKMQLKMKYEKGEPLRVHVVLEKADTMAMFQRDAHALENALNQAGLKTDSSSLTFDLGGQSAFGQALDHQNGSNGGNTPVWTPDSASGAVDETIETKLSVVIDPQTGLAHYNLLV